MAFGVVNSYVQWQTYKRDKVDVRVDVAFAMPTFSTADGSVQQGRGYVAVTATNIGRQPAGVDGMKLVTATGHNIPLFLAEPGTSIGGVLQPGEHRTMWVLLDALEATLRENRARLVSAEAYGPAGQRWATASLGDISKLGQ